MALQINVYTDPGVYIGEVVVPGAVNIATTPLQLGIIGVGDRTKAVTNEAVQRGLVSGESLTPVDLSGTGVTGTDSISAPASGIQTLVIAAGAFTETTIGQQLTIANDATHPTNNGTFVITDRTGPTTIKYLNPAGVVNATFGGTYSVSPFAILAKRSDRRVQNTTILKNSVALGVNFFSYQPAYVQGDVTATRDFTGSNQAMVLSLDGKTQLTLNFVGGGGPFAVASSGTQFNITTSAAQAAVPISEVASTINAVLTAATALGYGTAYSAVASSVSAGLRIVSPTTGPTSDVEVLPPIIDDLNAVGASRLFNTYVAPTGILAASVVSISRLVFASTATYLADYINIDQQQDPLAQTGVLSVSRVGTTAGISTFAAAVDYLLSGNNIDWGGPGLPPDTAPFFPAVGASGPITPYVVGGSAKLKLAFDGKASVEFDLIQVAPVVPVLGFTYGLASPLTATQVVANINASIANSALYGPAYKAVAAVANLGGGNFVQLTSPTEGKASQVQILVPSANSANTPVFGLSATQTVSVLGTGSRPILGSIYFASYSVTRATSEYNIQKRFFTTDQARADLGATTAQNPLMMAVEIAFENKAPSVVVVQVNDVSSPGSPTRTEFLTGLNSTTHSDVITDVVALSTDAGTQSDLKDHIEFESSPTEKHFRRGWFGMPRSTAPGDKDTVGTYVYESTRILQFAPDSAGRGRAILVAMPQLVGVSRTITLPDGTTQSVNVDGTFMAVAAAAKKTAFTSPAGTLASKTITGFNIADITKPWEQGERGAMAGQGVMVVTFIPGGIFKILDPVTTEVGGGGAAAFSYDNTSSQKDNISRKVTQALDDNVVGIVPTDLSDFIIDIKMIIRSVLAGEIGNFAIGPFRNPDNTTRAIDLSTDIDVQQDPDDPTKFFFKYFFNLRYAALRLFGEFSVDNPFFAPQQG